MKAAVHKEMAFQVVSDYPNPALLEFLIEAVAKPEWNKDRATKVKWVKEWMDMPDNSRHCSKMRNDHSYKLLKTAKGFSIQFIQGTTDQATVVARLKYAARDISEWVKEEEPRVAALELAKSVHWVIDSSTPPHTAADWDTDTHARVEDHFDKLWRQYYDKSQIDFNRPKEIKDIYRWAKARIEANYDQNMELLAIYKGGGSIKTGRGKEIGQAVIRDVAQNLADYFAMLDRLIKFQKLLAALPTT